jgi:hypothetical protein
VYFHPKGMMDQFNESPEAFQAFGAVLMPIIAQVGFEVGEPTVMPLHRIEQVARP